MQTFANKKAGALRIARERTRATKNAQKIAA
jgi:hypothetical protein